MRSERASHDYNQMRFVILTPNPNGSNGHWQYGKTPENPSEKSLENWLTGGEMVWNVPLEIWALPSPGLLRLCNKSALFHVSMRCSNEVTSFIEKWKEWKVQTETSLSYDAMSWFIKLLILCRYSDQGIRIFFEFLSSRVAKFWVLTCAAKWPCASSSLWSVKHSSSNEGVNRSYITDLPLLTCVFPGKTSPT